MTNGNPAPESVAPSGDTETSDTEARVGDATPAVIDALERRLAQAKQEWELRARQHSRVENRRWRARRARRTAAELARALDDYTAVWRALQQASREAEGDEPDSSAGGTVIYARRGG